MEISLYQIFVNWWWFFFPIIFFFPFRFFYFWWIRWEVFYKRFKWILLEIKPPRETPKPFSAMESVYSLLWGMWDSPNWRERWCKGALPCGAGGWFSFEICSFGGDIRIFLRIPEGFRTAAEAAIYSQYPDVEFTLVEDYTEKIPKDIPNANWTIYAEDYTLMKPDYYPIPTYSIIFERPEEEKRVREEKRIDPFDTLLEQLSKILPGEQLWIQIVCCPVTEDQVPFNWVAEGKKEADKIARRKVPSPPKPLLIEILETFIFGAKKGGGEGSSLELVAPELRLTGGEKEVLTAIENKIKKSGFLCWIKEVYLCQRDKPSNPAHSVIFRGYLSQQFSHQRLNRLVFYGGTRTRIHYWIKERRLYLRQRQRLREAIERFPSSFPWNITGTPPPLVKFLLPFGYRILPGTKSTCILSSEELATIFHFPAKVKVPTLPRVETKKAGPPPSLPTK